MAGCIKSGRRCTVLIRLLLATVSVACLVLSPSVESVFVRAETVPKVTGITFAVGWEPVSFYPLRGLDSASYYAQGLVYQGLLGYDRQTRIIPMLAESWNISPDRLQYRFKLRPGVKFSDGSLLTMADVLASIKLAIAPGSPYHGDYQDIQTVECISDQELLLILSHPSAPMASRLVELRILPARFLNMPDKGKQYLSRHPVGTGPFLLTAWESGSELVFQPNKHYWGKQPAYERLVWKIVPDHSLLAMALKKGEVDVAQCQARDWSAFLANSRSLALERFPGSRTVYLGLNLAKPPFNRPEMRRALSMVVNRRVLIDGLYSGYASEAANDFAPSGWAYDKRICPSLYNPKEAAQLLEQAGFRHDRTGWLDSAGKRLAFGILTLPDYEDLALSIASDLHKFGIPAVVQLVEYSTLRQQYLKRHQFQSVVWSRSVGPDPECYLVWHSKGSLNLYGYADERLDSLLEDGRRVNDAARRKDIYSEIQKLLARDVPSVFLFHPDLLLVHSNRVHGVKQPGQEVTGLPWDNPLFNAADWTVK